MHDKPFPTPILQSIVTKAVKQVIKKSGPPIVEKTEKLLKRREIMSKKAIARKYAKRIGLEPIDDSAISRLRIELTQKIIDEVKNQKLRHIDVAAIVHASRPKITRILNYNFKGVGLEFLIQIILALGIEISITYKPNVLKQIYAQIP